MDSPRPSPPFRHSRLLVFRQLHGAVTSDRWRLVWETQGTFWSNFIATENTTWAPKTLRWFQEIPLLQKSRLGKSRLLTKIPLFQENLGWWRKIIKSTSPKTNMEPFVACPPWKSEYPARGWLGCSYDSTCDQYHYPLDDGESNPIVVEYSLNYILPQIYHRYPR